MLNSLLIGVIAGLVAGLVVFAIAYLVAVWPELKNGKSAQPAPKPVEKKEPVEETAEEEPVEEAAEEEPEEEVVEETAEEEPEEEVVEETVVEEVVEETVEEETVEEEVVEETVVEEVVEETVEEEPVEEVVEETVVEEEVKEEPVEEKAEEAEPVKEEKPARKVAKKEVAAADEDDDDDDDDEEEGGAEAETEEERAAREAAIADAPELTTKQRFDRSFMSRIIQSSDLLKDWYSEVEGAALAFKSARANVAWKQEKIRCGKDLIAKLAIRGKTLCIYLPLNVSECDERIRVEDVSNKAVNADAPTLLRLKNPLRVRQAQDLLKQVGEKLGLESSGRHRDHDYKTELPLKTTEQLVEEGLIKIIEK